jgi:hypothetical protein
MFWSESRWNFAHAYRPFSFALFFPFHFIFLLSQHLAFVLHFTLQRHLTKTPLGVETCSDHTLNSTIHLPSYLLLISNHY